MSGLQRTHGSEPRATKPQAESRAGMRREGNAHVNQNGTFLWLRHETFRAPRENWQLLNQKSCLDFLFIFFCQAEQKDFCIQNETLVGPDDSVLVANLPQPQPIIPWQFSTLKERGMRIPRSNSANYPTAGKLGTTDTTSRKQKEGKSHWGRKYSYCQIPKKSNIFQ